MERGTHASPASLPLRRFGGVRVMGAVALASALGGAGATAISWALDRLDAPASALLEEDLELRIQAGRLALAAIEEAAAAGKSGEGDRDARRDRALARAQNALVSLAAPKDPIRPPRNAVPLLLLGTLVGAATGAAWAGFRLGGPLERTLKAARDFVHGDNDARAKDAIGGRDTRDIARAVNALIETAQRLKLQGRAAREEDVRAAVLAIEAVGQGDLTVRVPEVGPVIDLVVAAIDRARKNLLERISEIHQVSMMVASSAADVAPGAKKIAVAAFDQVEALKSLAGAAQDAAEAVKASNQKLSGALERLARFVAEERKVELEMQAALKGASRRAQELRRAVVRMDGLIATSEAIDDVIELLAGGGDGRSKLRGQEPAAKARVATAVGEGRAAMDAIGRELAMLRDEMGETAASLDAIAESVPSAPPNLDASVSGSLHESAINLLRITELTAGCLKSLERASKAIAEGAQRIEQGALSASELAPRLGALLSSFNLGTSFEGELLERLERWKKEADEAQATPGGLTADGRQMLKQVADASEAARTRLARLVSATEAAIDVLRG